MNPLQGSGVSARSRCGAVPMRILAVADKPSTGIGRVGALSLWCRANPCPDHRKDLKNRSPNLGPYTTKGTLKELPYRIYFLDPSGGLGELAGEPSAGIGRVGSLAGEPSAGIGVVPCASLPWPMNPLQGSGVSDRSPANPLRGSVWCRAHPCRGR